MVLKGLSFTPAMPKNGRIFYNSGRNGSNFTNNVVNKNPWLIIRRYSPYPGGRRLRNYEFYIILPFKGVRNLESKARRGNKGNYLIPRTP